MVYTEQIKKAIRFAIKTHEVYQKQKRKGKDVPYITHPLAVGLILAHAGASEDVIVAGILHDTIEDSTKAKKVSKAMIEARFGRTVAKLVEDVTEPSKDVPWEQRKQEALEHIKTLSQESLLVKSADILSNTGELIDDYKDEGEKTFSRFNAPKEKILDHYDRLITAILKAWPESPLAKDLHEVQKGLSDI
jgi:(p)ppGpp synthase/HD superfamily hydrolase